MLARAQSILGAGAVALVLVAGAGLEGCGGAARQQPVALRVTAPLDSAVVRDRMIEVRGRVRPSGARVLVAGRRATVSGHDFRVTVPLRSGPNVVDLGAWAPGSQTTWAAVRVTREIVVKLPDLVGAPRGDAVDRLASLGLRSEVAEQRSFFDILNPAAWGVCETGPHGGAVVPKGTLVRIVVSKSC
jgi:PASTA domain